MAGRGRRMATVSRTLPKALLPLSSGMVEGFYDCNLSRIVATARSLGASRIVAATTGTPIDQAAARVLGIEDVQSAPLGEANAVAEAMRHLSGTSEEVTAIWSADNIIDIEDVRSVIDSARAADSLTALVGVAEVQDLAEYTRVEVREHGEEVIGLTEKPKEAGAGLAKSGFYALRSAALVTCLAQSTLDRFGEWSMTGALEVGMRSGVNVRSHVLHGGFLDIGDPKRYYRVVADADA
ncbi:nucleotidyltransferase family protein [Paenarthrobacter nitroguajacolicus]|uniref:nucleotidyltransferase family protein n=1 Tax=Paenarthrobacter nitroguajacolicus TaxID=211146 RepID=UPI003AE4C705